MSEEFLSDLPLWSDKETRAIMEELCRKHKVPVDVLTDLVVIQRIYQDKIRASGIYDAFSEVLSRIDSECGYVDLQN